MNNNGFTLVEFLITIVIISISLYVVMFEVIDTFSITKDTSYKLMKENIVKVSSDYVRECNNGIINCSLNWENNMTFFYAKELLNNGYFKNLNSPYDGKDLSNCIKIYAYHNNGNIDISLEDLCY